MRSDSALHCATKAAQDGSHSHDDRSRLLPEGERQPAPHYDLLAVPVELPVQAKA
jgi:hypothetical protein